MATTKPRKIKVFTVETWAAVINRAEREALGLDKWITQGDVLVSAPTKVAALEALEAAGHRQTANLLRLNDGGEIETLVEAGVFDGSTKVIVKGGVGNRHNRNVLDVTGKNVRVIGRLDGSWPQVTFTPAGTDASLT